MTFINAMLPANMSSIVWTAVAQFAAFMSQSFPMILAQGVQFITQLVSGFLQGIPLFLETAGSMLNSLLIVFLNALPSMLSSGMQLILNLASGLISSLPAIVSSATSIIAQLLSTIATHLPDLLAQGISLVAQLVAGLISMIPDVITTAGNIIQNIITTFGNTDWISIGTNIIRGIASGIASGVGIIIQAAKDAAMAAYNAAKSALDIESPSRLFRKEVGYRMPQGAALGVYDGIPLLNRAMDEMSGLANRKFTSRLKMSANFSGTNGGGLGRQIVINQHIYSEAKTAADLMREARYEAEKAVLFGV